MAAGPPPAPAPSAAVAIYHYPCHDGIFAALAAHLHFRRSCTPVRFVPHRVYEALDAAALELSKSDTAYLLDYAGPPGLAQRLCQTAGRVVVLDHHKTAVEQLGAVPSESLPPNLEVNLDMQRSGATLALDYFCPSGLTEAQRRLFSFVEDADLWRWRLPDSKQFHAGLVDLKLDYDAAKTTGVFDQLLQLTPETLIARGRDVIARQDEMVAAIVSASYPIQLGGAQGAAAGWGTCLAARADAAPDLRSHIGNALAIKSQAAGLSPIGAVVYVEPAMRDEGQYKVSLRSLGDDDTTVVSSALGGGGHRNASSFTAAAQEVDSWQL